MSQKTVIVYRREWTVEVTDEALEAAQAPFDPVVIAQEAIGAPVSEPSTPGWPGVVTSDRAYVVSTKVELTD